ncbi:MAG TPA: glycosyltransferase [Casimicrobiaceae bacterium]|jgi:alpha-1,6-mannosyltransferase
MNVSLEAMSKMRYGPAAGKVWSSTALERRAPNGAPIDMHVLDTTMLYGPMGGGVARYLKEKRSWLARNSPCRHSLLVPGAFNGIGEDGEHFIATWAPNEASRRWPMRTSPWLHAIRRYAPDIIEAEDPGLVGWVALHAARELGVPLVAFCHSDVAGHVARRFGTAAGRVTRGYLQAFYRRCDVVLTPSEFMRRRLFDWHVENVVVRPLGVDLKTFNPRARTMTLRRELGLAGNARLLVYAGRFAREKNLSVLTGAFRKLGRPYYLLMLGAGESLPPQANVIVRPYERSSRELARVLASADGLVHAGDQETFGLVLLEAMACGRGVIAPAAGAAPELVTLETGMLAPARDAGALASTIEAFYQRDLDAMGRRARTHVERSYGWDSVMRGLLELYRAVQRWEVRGAARYVPS